VLFFFLQGGGLKLDVLLFGRSATVAQQCSDRRGKVAQRRAENGTSNFRQEYCSYVASHIQYLLVFPFAYKSKTEFNHSANNMKCKNKLCISSRFSKFETFELRLVDYEYLLSVRYFQLCADFCWKCCYSRLSAYAVFVADVQRLSYP
jgi:hypothetical protein